MARPWISSCCDTARDSLRENTTCLDQKGPGHWHFTIRNSPVVQGDARVEGEWLQLDATPPASDKRGNEAGQASAFWRLLEANSRLAGGVRFGLRNDGEVRLLAEIPLDEDVDIAGCVQRACFGLRDAVRASQTAPLPSTENDPATPDGAKPQKAGCAPGALCAEAGWPYAERATGDVAVELETGDTCYQALLTAGPPARATVPFPGFLVSRETPAAVCRDAVGAFLLTAAGLIRMARPVIDPDLGMRFEVAFDGTPSVAEVNHALSALSVACGWCGAELVALQDEGVARQYLQQRGRSS